MNKINGSGSNNNYLKKIFDFSSYTTTELGLLFIINWKKSILY